MVHVQQRALRAFEHQVATALVHGVQLSRHVRHHRLQARRIREHLVENLLVVHGFRAQVLGQHEVVEFHVLAQALGEVLRIEQVLHAQRAAGNLVFVGRADATAGGADLGGATARFAGLVDGYVVRQDQRGGFGDAQAVLHLQAGGLEFLDLTEERLGRQHNAVADIADGALAHDPRRDQSQDGLLAADDERVAGVVAALEPHHAFCMIGKPIDDFPFAFVTPLGSDHDDIASLAYCGCGHVELVRRLKTYSTLVAGRCPIFGRTYDAATAFLRRKKAQKSHMESGGKCRNASCAPAESGVSGVPPPRHRPDEPAAGRS